MSIGERIIALRKEKSISQYQLAKLMEVSRQAVSKWENGQSSPDTVKLIQLAELLETDVEYLATGNHQKATPSPAPITIEKEVERVVEVEKTVEKPVFVEKRVEIEKIVEVPVVKKRVRTKYVRNPAEYAFVAVLFFAIGVIFGLFL